MEKNNVNKAQAKIAALKAAGIDVSNLFAMNTGEVAVMNDGVMSVLPDIKVGGIISEKTIHAPRLFRRWVMSQMFHMLNSEWGVTKTLHARGADYQWKVIDDELEAQVKLFRNDMENFEIRHGWFNEAVVYKICQNYDKALRRYVDKLPVKKCKGEPYKTVGGKHYFVKDIESRLLNPVYFAVQRVKLSRTTQELLDNFRFFNRVRVRLGRNEPVSTAFLDAYKGVGAYYTMQNMILFHDCSFAGMGTASSMALLREKNMEYSPTHKQAGWRLMGVLKKLISESGIDIKAKMAEWRKRK